MNNKKIQWFKSEFPGIRYYVHNSRKHGVQFDKYFSGQYQVAGKRKAIGFGWMSEGWSAKKAWQKLNEFKHNAKTGEGPTTLKEEQKLKQEQKAAEEAERQRLKNRNLSFSDFFTHTYFPQAREDKKESSCRKELGMFNKWIAPAIGEKGLQEISVSDLEAIKKVMSNAGCSTRLIQYCLAVIRQVFNRAIALELLDYKNPVSKIKIPSPNNKRTRFLSEEEANKLLNGLAEHSQDLHDMALLSLHCGLRSGEIFKLTWNDVDFDQRTIHIRDAKANKDRFAYMTLKVLDMFQSRYELSENKLKLISHYLIPNNSVNILI